MADCTNLLAIFVDFNNLLLELLLEILHSQNSCKQKAFNIHSGLRVDSIS